MRFTNNCIFTLMLMQSNELQITRQDLLFVFHLIPHIPSNLDEFAYSDLHSPLIYVNLRFGVYLLQPFDITAAGSINLALLIKK